MYIGAEDGFRLINESRLRGTYIFTNIIKVFSLKYFGR
jgi:hypothetical protein